METIKKKINGKIILLSAIDEYLFNSHAWYLIKARQLTEKYYVATVINKKTVYLHRLITEAIKGEVVDHENRNTLDCTRGNLRTVSPSFNRLNCTVRENKKGSKFKGVYYKESRTKPYYSMIRSGNYKTIYLGSFKTEIDAAVAYNNKMSELYNISA